MTAERELSQASLLASAELSDRVALVRALGRVSAFSWPDTHGYRRVDARALHDLWTVLGRINGVEPSEIPADALRSGDPGYEVPATSSAILRRAIEAAVVGDLVLGYERTGPSALGPGTNRVRVIEQVTDGTSAKEIVGRWLDQGVIVSANVVQIWECRPGGHYRLRGSLL